MNIYPDLYLDSILELSVETLNKNNIKGLMIDIDNTVVDTEKNIIDTINDYGRNRGKYQKGSNKNPITGTGGRTKKADQTDTTNEPETNTANSNKEAEQSAEDEETK